MIELARISRASARESPFYGHFRSIRIRSDRKWMPMGAEAISRREGAPTEHWVDAGRHFIRCAGRTIEALGNGARILKQWMTDRIELATAVTRAVEDDFAAASLILESGPSLAYSPGAVAGLATVAVRLGCKYPWLGGFAR